MLGASLASAQNTDDLAKVETAVRLFSSAGDHQNADQLDQLLHPQYRSVMNRLFGKPDVSLMDKPTYLQMIREKKLGGDTREVTVLHIEMGAKVATVKAVFQGKMMKFTTFISLVKLESGAWQIIGDMPEVEKV
jgi:hypothetical protein